MRTVSVHAARIHLSRLVAEVAGGEEIVIARAGKPLARLVPFAPDRGPRRPGLMKGKLWVAEDFDEPPPEAIMTTLRGERP